jgi:hypothetical protein
VLVSVDGERIHLLPLIRWAHEPLDDPGFDLEKSHLQVDRWLRPGLDQALRLRPR